jgi:hypothetical protein
MMCQAEGSGIQDYHLWQPALFISSTSSTTLPAFLDEKVSFGSVFFKIRYLGEVVLAFL